MQLLQDINALIDNLFQLSLRETVADLTNHVGIGKYVDSPLSTYLILVISKRQ